MSEPKHASLLGSTGSQTCTHVGPLQGPEGETKAVALSPPRRSPGPSPSPNCPHSHSRLLPDF